MRIVIALGGNALLRRGEPLTADTQRRNVRRAVEALAPLAAGHELVITPGRAGGRGCSCPRGWSVAAAA